MSNGRTVVPHARILSLACVAALAACGERHPVGKKDPGDVLPSDSSAAASPSDDAQKKKKECAALTKVVNDGVDRVAKESASPAGKDAAADLLAMADIMDQQVKLISALELTRPELIADAREYSEMSKLIADASRAMKVALDTKDLDAIKKAQTVLEAATTPESPLVEKINAYCSGR